jgi:L-aspartate oxidase
MVVAHAAGATLADLEMVQFHPTALANGGDRDGMLITEAIRGEGATLVDADGQRFVDELAPRDEVALAINQRMIDTGSDSVALDMTSVDPKLFPNVVESLNTCGIDQTTELVPVAPAAHYVMGGIQTDLHGQSTLPGLFAIGETACTGLHGANRLASNSLTECFVFGRRAALASLDAASAAGTHVEQVACEGPVMPSPQTRAALWANAGLVRDRAGLESLLTDEHPLARLVATCALAREESRGAHRRGDFPATQQDLDGHHSSLSPDGTSAMVAWDPSDAASGVPTPAQLS